MTNRTFKQFGSGYSEQGTVSIVAMIDGVQVYNGPVPTLTAAVPSQPSPALKVESELFSFTEDVDYTGLKQMSITVTGGCLLLSLTKGNYSISDANADIFRNLEYHREFTADATPIIDPLTDIVIDGVSCERNLLDFGGQWWWQIQDGSTFTCSINIEPGYESPLPLF
jgi:hypothetical protein